MKIRTVSGRLQFLIFPVLAVLLLFSCSDPESPPLEETGPDRTTSDGLLQMFAKSYAEMDLNDYEVCLDEYFLFEFTVDIADSLGLPPEKPWWGKTDDVSSTHRMFEDPRVLDVVFNYETLGDWEPYQEVRDDTTYSGFFRRIDPLIEVTVTLSDPYYETLRYRADASWLDVVIMPDRFTNGLWSILRINEVKKQLLLGPVVSQSAATEPSSWGNIKAIWAD